MQKDGLCEEVGGGGGGGLNGFCLNCSDAGVEPRQSDGLLGVFCCAIKPVDGGVFWIVRIERSRGFIMGDEGILN